jgi:hypothetical protein
MAFQTAVVFAPPKMTDVQLFRRMDYDFGQDPHALDKWLADARVFRILVKEDAIELHPAARLNIAIVNAHAIAFADPILT